MNINEKNKYKRERERKRKRKISYIRKLKKSIHYKKKKKKSSCKFRLKHTGPVCLPPQIQTTGEGEKNK